MRHQTQGFSIIEVVMIMALIALLGIVTVPSTKMLHRQQTKKVARAIALDLYAQRAKAMMIQEETKFSLILGSSGNYTSYELSPKKTDASGREENHSATFSEKMTLNIKIIQSEDETLNGTPITELYFSPKGEMFTKKTPTENKVIYEVDILTTYEGSESELNFNGETGNYRFK